MSATPLQIAGFTLPSPQIASQLADDDALAGKLLSWLLERHRGDLVLLRRVVQYGPYAVRNSEDARRALNLLADRGRITAMSGIKYRGFVRKEAWAVPA